MLCVYWIRSNFTLNFWPYFILEWVIQLGQRKIKKKTNKQSLLSSNTWHEHITVYGKEKPHNATPYMYFIYVWRRPCQGYIVVVFTHFIVPFISHVYFFLLSFIISWMCHCATAYALKIATFDFKILSLRMRYQILEYQELFSVFVCISVNV